MHCSYFAKGLPQDRLIDWFFPTHVQYNCLGVVALPFGNQVKISSYCRQLTMIHWMFIFRTVHRLYLLPVFLSTHSVGPEKKSEPKKWSPGAQKKRWYAKWTAERTMEKKMATKCVAYIHPKKNKKRLKPNSARCQQKQSHSIRTIEHTNQGKYNKFDTKKNDNHRGTRKQSTQGHKKAVNTEVQESSQEINMGTSQDVLPSFDIERDHSSKCHSQNLISRRHTKQW